jgi:DNA methylase
MPQLKAYLDESSGIPVGTIWDDLRPLGLRDDEHVGFPSQQPAALLEGVSQRASNRGDLIIDAYCGSGTSLVTAHRQDRRWIGGDSMPEVVHLCRSRLVSAGLAEGREWKAYSALDLTAIEAKPCLLRRIVTMMEDLNAADVLIAEGESEWVERKVAAYWNAMTDQKEEKMKDKFVRSVAQQSRWRYAPSRCGRQRGRRRPGRRLPADEHTEARPRFVRALASSNAE